MHPGHITGSRFVSADGAEREVYRVGDYIVKTMPTRKDPKTGAIKPNFNGYRYSSRDWHTVLGTFGYRKVRAEFFHLGVSKIRQWIVYDRRNHCWWCIQPAVQPLGYGTVYVEHYYTDLHSGNLALVGDKLVAFDW